MVETGFFNLLTSGIPSVKGYAVELPKDTVTAANPSAWTYRSILSRPTYTLTGQDPFTRWEVQIDCHGYAFANCLTTARAITDYLSGAWHGTLTDADAIKVLGIYRLPGTVDGFDDANRTFVRSLEYEIQYYEV